MPKGSGRKPGRKLNTVKQDSKALNILSSEMDLSASSGSKDVDSLVSDSDMPNLEISTVHIQVQENNLY